MGLDILTEKGQETLAQELRAAEIIRSVWPDAEYYHTDKRKAAAVDAIIIRPPEVKAVAATSCRQCTLAVLRGQFGNELLLTYDKLEKGRLLADLLCVDFWIIGYLVPDDVVLRLKLYRPGGDWLARVRKDRTVTQATVNGGSALRLNGYIDMQSADVLRERASQSGVPGNVGLAAE